MEKAAVVSLGLGYSKNKGYNSSQTIENLQKGVSLFCNQKKWSEVPVELACSGMTIIPDSNPPTLQEMPMYGWVWQHLENRDLISEVRALLQDTPEIRILCKSTCGNAFQILLLAKEYGWTNVFIVDHPLHQKRLDAALQYVARLAHMNIDFVYVKVDVDASDQGQFVAKYLPVFWVYELLNMFYQPFQLAHRRKRFKKVFESF